MANSPLSAFEQLNNSYNDQMSMLQQRANALPQARGILANADPAGLALIAGLLKPSATGSFAENLGNAAEAVQAPLSSMRKEQLDAQDKIAALKLSQLKLAAEAPMWQARAARYNAMANSAGSYDLTPLHEKQLLQNRSSYEKALNIATDPSDIEFYQSQINRIDGELSKRTGVTKAPPTPKAEKPADTGSHWYDPTTWFNSSDSNSSIAAPAAAPTAAPSTGYDASGNPIPPQTSQALAPAPAQTAPAQAAPAQPTAAAPASKLKKPPQAILKKALDAINGGADPTAVVQKLNSYGFSSEGLQ